jgi:hypothetical protein
MTKPRVDLRRVAEEVRPPLVGVAADETVEVVEAHARRPLGEGSDLAGLIGRRVVILAKPARGVAVVAQDTADRGVFRADDAVVAGEAGGLLGNHAEADRVMVAPGNQRGTRRRAERGGEHPVVAQPVGRDAVHGRCRDDAAESARHGESGIVGHDQQDIGRAFGRHHTRRPPGFGLQGVVLDDTAEGRFWRRQLLAADGGGGTG